jgi:Acyl-CoA reductase (LuxC)
MMETLYSATGDPLDAASRFVGRRATAPFAAAVLDFCDELSGQLLASAATRDFPEIQAFGFAIRRAALNRWAKAFNESTAAVVRVPRGCVLHFAPANVPTVFAYSWLWATLLGNHSIVRLSERRPRASRLLEEVLFKSLAAADPSLRCSTVAVSYAHDVELTQKLSAFADVRIIWGGDASVRAIRGISGRPGGVDLGFADRMSACVLRADYVKSLNSTALEELASALAVDICTFDQAACSSPRIAVWVGSQDDFTVAAKRLWHAVDAELERRGYFVDTAAAIMKMTEAAVQAAAGTSIASLVPSNRLTVTRGIPELLESRCATAGWGMVHEFCVSDLADLPALCSSRLQTVVSVGFDRATLNYLVLDTSMTGVDRIVAPGEALAFDRYWDGFDMMLELTRTLHISARL